MDLFKTEYECSSTEESSLRKCWEAKEVSSITDNVGRHFEKWKNLSEDEFRMYKMPQNTNYTCSFKDFVKR